MDTWETLTVVYGSGNLLDMDDKHYWLSLLLRIPFAIFCKRNQFPWQSGGLIW